MRPGSISARNDALRAQNRAGSRTGRRSDQSLTRLDFIVDMRRLDAPAGKDLVRIMSMMMMVMVMMVMAAFAFLIVIVMMTALAFLVVIMMMTALALLVMIVVVTAFALLIVIVMMATFALLIVIVMMAALALLVMIVMMAAFALFVVIVMRQTFVFLHQLFHQFLLFHRFQDLRSADRFPWRCDDHRLRVLFLGSAPGIQPAFLRSASACGLEQSCWRARSGC